MVSKAARHEGKLASKAKPFEEVEPMIKRNLEQKAKMEATEKFRETLKKRICIKNFYVTALRGILAESRRSKIYKRVALTCWRNKNAGE